MAESDSRKTYPKLPAKNWWDLRRQFQKSPPKSVDSDYVMTVLGLTSPKAAGNVLLPLRTVGLIDEGGATTPLAHDWRDDETYPEVCRKIIAAVYPTSLSELFPPPDPDQDGLKKWFARNAGVGEAAAGQMTAFYRLLCEADPKGAETTTQRRPTAQPARAAARRPTKAAAKAVTKTQAPPPVEVPTQVAPPAKVNLGGVGGVTINIELQIPATADAKFFDQFFSSMRKHLLDENE
jgi:hypothetical protein